MAGSEGGGPSRRTLIAGVGVGAVGLGVATRALAQAGGGAPPPVDVGQVQGGKVTFPPSQAQSESKGDQPPNPKPPGSRVGFAVIGLGKLALEQVLPAFAESKNARLVALVSGSPDKLRTVAGEYGVRPDSCYSYESFARIRDNPEVDAVYVITPNALHHRDVLAAAQAGKHVLCEKPMATSSAEARDMTAACRAANRKLMIAYRMQYEPHVRAVTQMCRSGAIGQPVLFDMVNNQNQGDPNQWRQKRALAGGGSLPDVGLYCLNTTRAILGEEPSEVWATIWSPRGDPRFREVENNVSFTLRFPSGAIANCLTSYSTHRLSRLKVMGSEAWLEMERAFEYQGQNLRISRLEAGQEQTGERMIPRKNQFALELDHMSDCIRQDRQPRTPGEEGVQDHVLMEAIYESARTGRPIRLSPRPGLDVFRGPALPQES
jgi:predicted dehydrogenase